MKSLKELAAATVKWHGLDRDFDVAHLTKELCCDNSSQTILENGVVVQRADVACYNGHVECLKQAGYKSKDNFERYLKIAVPAGRTEMVQFLFSREVKRGISKIVLRKHAGLLAVLAAKHGKPGLLRWALNAAPPHQHALNDACSFAALRGHEVCFEMCLALRPALSMACAIRGGNADIVDATAERVERIDARDFALAAKLGSLGSLASMLRFSSNWDETTPAAASRFGHLECLRFAHENGCQWTDSALATAHRECFDYATEHGCGTDKKCRCVVRETKREENGKFFRNLDPLEDGSPARRRKHVVPMNPGSKNWAKRAVVWSKLEHALPRSIESFVATLERTMSIKEMADFARCRKPRHYSKEIAQLEEAAYRHETGARELQMSMKTWFRDEPWDMIKLEWCNTCFTVIETGPAGSRGAISWSPEQGLVCLREGTDKLVEGIVKEKFIMNRNIDDNLLNVACFLFSRSFEDAFSIFHSQGEYNEKRKFPKPTKMYRRVEDMFSSNRGRSPPPTEPLPPMTPEIEFVMFLREHGVCVTEDFLALGAKVRLWRARREYGADHLVLIDRIVYDTRNRMCVPLEELLANMDRVPARMLYVLFLFSKTISKLNAAYENATVKTTPTNVSAIVKVSAVDYCRNAVREHFWKRSENDEAPDDDSRESDEESDDDDSSESDDESDDDESDDDSRESDEESDSDDESPV